MILYGATTFICIGLAILAAALSVDKAMLLLVFFAPFTTTAVASIGGNSVIFYQLLWLVVAVKVFFHRRKSGQHLNKTWFPFLLFSFLTIPVALFKGDVLVVNVESQISHARFSFQQFTQWGYLCIALSTATFVEYLLRVGSLRLSSLIRCIDFAAVAVLLVAFLQTILPADFLTATIRNSVHSAYAWDGARISSTFQEPSMLSLYLMPLFAAHLIRFVMKPSFLSFGLMASIIAVSLSNGSSSAFLALGISVFTVFMIQGKKLFVEKISHGVVLMLLFLVATVAIALLSGVFEDEITHMLNKMFGEGVSGVERMAEVKHTWGVFLDNPIFGVGWGTSRCAVFFDWLSEIGIIGFTLTVILPILRILVLLWRGQGFAHEVFCYLVTALALLFFVSSEGYYLSLWIFMGIAKYLVFDENTGRESRSFKSSLLESDSYAY